MTMTGIKGRTKSAVPMRAWTESYQQAVTSVFMLVKASHMAQFKIRVGKEIQSSALAGRTPKITEGSKCPSSPKTPSEKKIYITVAHNQRKHEFEG